MWWPRQPRLVRFKQGRRRSDALSPLLRGVKREAPPEGLLLKIEQALDNDTVEPAPSRRAILAGVSTAGVLLVGTCWFLFTAPQHVVLIDQTGRPIVRLSTQSGVTEAALSVVPVAFEAELGWHLWGLSDGTPIHLGVFSDGGLVIEDAARFAGFALSLESNPFRGERPVGPVIKLSAEKN